MSVSYGEPTGAYAPPGRVNFGWIGEAFALFQANAGLWIVATLLSLVPILVGAIVGAIYGATAAASGNVPPPPDPSDRGAVLTRALSGGLPPVLNLGIRIVTAIYTAWLAGGVYRTAVKQVRGEAVSISDLFGGGDSMWKMLGFNIVYNLLTFIGTLFCIVPGALLAGLLFPGYALIADGESLGEAISRSMAAMKRDMWNAAAFIFVMGLLLLVSLIPCGLGLFVTLPMLYLVTALAYRDMIGMPGLGAPASAYGAGQYGAPPPNAPGVWPPPPGQQSPYGQPPPPSFGQPPPPPAAPPRRSLGDDPLDDDGGTPPSPNPPR